MSLRNLAKSMLWSWVRPIFKVTRQILKDGLNIDLFRYTILGNLCVNISKGKSTPEYMLVIMNISKGKYMPEYMLVIMKIPRTTPERAANGFFVDTYT